MMPGDEGRIQELGRNSERMHRGKVKERQGQWQGERQGQRQGQRQGEKQGHQQGDWQGEQGEWQEQQGERQVEGQGEQLSTVPTERDGTDFTDAQYMETAQWLRDPTVLNLLELHLHRSLLDIPSPSCLHVPVPFSPLRQQQREHGSGPGVCVCVCRKLCSIDSSDISSPESLRRYVQVCDLEDSDCQLASPMSDLSVSPAGSAGLGLGPSPTAMPASLTNPQAVVVPTPSLSVRDVTNTQSSKDSDVVHTHCSSVRDVPHSVPNPGLSLPTSVPCPWMSLTTSVPNPEMSLTSSVPNPGMSLKTSVPNPGMSLTTSVPHPGISLTTSVLNPGMSLSPSAPNTGMFLTPSVPNPVMVSTPKDFEFGSLFPAVAYAMGGVEWPGDGGGPQSETLTPSQFQCSMEQDLLFNEDHPASIQFTAADGQRVCGQQVLVSHSHEQMDPGSTLPHYHLQPPVSTLCQNYPQPPIFALSQYHQSQVSALHPHRPQPSLSPITPPSCHPPMPTLPAYAQLSFSRLGGGAGRDQPGTGLHPALNLVPPGTRAAGIQGVATSHGLPDVSLCFHSRKSCLTVHGSCVPLQCTAVADQSTVVAHQPTDVAARGPGMSVQGCMTLRGFLPNGVAQQALPPAQTADPERTRAAPARGRKRKSVRCGPGQAKLHRLPSSQGGTSAEGSSVCAAEDTQPCALTGVVAYRSVLS